MGYMPRISAPAGFRGNASVHERPLEALVYLSYLWEPSSEHLQFNNIGEHSTDHSHNFIVYYSNEYPVNLMIQGDVTWVGRTDGGKG